MLITATAIAIMQIYVVSFKYRMITTIYDTKRNWKTVLLSV